MAKYKKSGIGPNPGGKLGNIIFSENQYGPNMYIQPDRVGGFTNAQTIVQNRLWNVAKVYREKLTQQQYIAWAAFGKHFKQKDKHGNAYILSAKDAFAKVNRKRQEIDLPFILDPPPMIILQPFNSFTVEMTGKTTFEDIIIHFDPAIDKDTRVQIFATRRLRTCVFYINPGWYRNIGYLNANFYSGDSILKIYEFTNPIRVFTEFKIGFMFIPVSITLGLASQPVEFTALYNPEIQTQIS